MYTPEDEVNNYVGTIFEANDSLDVEKFKKKIITKENINNITDKLKNAWKGKNMPNININESIVEQIISKNRFIEEKLSINGKVKKEDFKKFISIYNIYSTGYFNSVEKNVYVTELFYLFSLDGIYYTFDNIDNNINKNNEDKFLIRRSKSKPDMLIFVYYDTNKTISNIIINLYGFGFTKNEEEKGKNNLLSVFIINKIKELDVKPYKLPNYWPNKSEQKAGYFNKYLKYKMKYLSLKYN